MLKLLNALILASIFLFLSCDENPLEPENANSFFPLKLGNKWYYRQYTTFNDSLKFKYPDKEYDLTFEIIGDKEIDGKTYSVLEGTSYDYSSQFYPIRVDTSYCRNEGSRFFWLGEDSYGYHNLMIADFSVSEGDTFSFNRDNNSTSTTVGTVKKRTWAAITIFYDIPNVSDDESEVTFVRNIGLQNSASLFWNFGQLLAKFQLN